MQFLSIANFYSSWNYKTLNLEVGSIQLILQIGVLMRQVTTIFVYMSIGLVP